MSDHIENEIKKIAYDFEKKLERLKTKYADLFTSDPDLFAALAMAEQLRSKIQVFTLVDKFSELELEAKVEYIMNEGFDTFYTEFPIVTKLLLAGDYDDMSFKRFLILCKNKMVQSTDNKESMEDKWIQCQASYFRFLYEAKQVHVDKKKSDAEWLNAYTKLKKEFQDFKNEHEKASVKVKEDINRYKTDKLKELAIIADNQDLSGMTEMSDLQIKLEGLFYKQNFDRCLMHISAKIPIPPVISGMGTNVDAEEQYNEEIKISEYRKRNKFTLG